MVIIPLYVCRPIYSGLYHGFYEQGKQRGINTRMPVQPFELLFEEGSPPTPIKKKDDDDHEDTAADGCRITGKGADLVGPYTLSGKALGNKVSMIKINVPRTRQSSDRYWPRGHNAIDSTGQSTNL